MNRHLIDYSNVWKPHDMVNRDFRVYGWIDLGDKFGIEMYNVRFEGKEMDDLIPRCHMSFY